MARPSVLGGSGNRRSTLMACSAGAAALSLLGAPAHATLLTFDPIPAPDAQVLQIYGDRVTSTTQFGYNYGADFGFTPNVVTEYRPTLRYRQSGHGDLENFLYRQQGDGDIMEIVFTADAGFRVCLHYFDLAAEFGEALPVKSVRVQTGQAVDLFRVDWVEVPDIVEARPLPPGQTGTLTHLRFNFDPALCNAPILKIRIDLSNLGIKVPQIGIDNIAISQDLVPTPGAGALAVVAGVALGARRRRRN